MTQQSGVFPIYLRAEYRDTGQLQRFQSDAQRAAQSAAREFKGVGAALDAALSRQRNSAGSLDLGVDELRQAAAAKQQVAVAAREVAEATRNAATANGAFDSSMSRTTRAAFKLANAEEQSARELSKKVVALDRVQAELNQTASATDLVTAANRRSIAANGASVRSQGALRNASIQAGQQLQDIQVQLQSGTRASLVFSQQLPQLAFALSGLSQSANAGTKRIGQMASLLSGPWGVAVFGATALLGPFIDNLFRTQNGAQAAAKGLVKLETQADRTANAIERLRGLQTQDIELDIATAEIERSALQTKILRGDLNLAELRRREAPETIIKGVERNQFRRRQEVLELDQAIFNGRRRLNEQAEKEAKREAKRNAVADRRAAAALQKAQQEAEQLSRFGQRSAERIARLNERFDEQARLVDLAAQSTRELDRIIAELFERRPAGFKQMIDDAEEAKLVIEDALVRPLEDIKREARERLQVEGLLAQGRQDEARALQTVLRLEEQIGDLSRLQKDEIEDLVRFERERTDVLRIQGELTTQQADVARTVASDLTDLLSGRSADLIGNFRQSLLDLQGARLFEDFFGPAFREIEQELAGNTPQGRANARYTAEVEKTAEATEVAGKAALDFANAVNAAAAGVRAGPANDNDSQIVVPGDSAEVEIRRTSINEIADRISRGVSEPIAAQLEDLLGPRFASALGDVIGGVFKGQVFGGTPGAVLGGLEGLLGTGLLGNDNRITNLASQALGGTFTGSQVAGFSNALGLGGSTSGAQVGGALGSFLPIPGGDIVGAIAGNFLGSILGGTKRGSATIGGFGGSLGITGVRGNSSSREDAATGLADQVLDAIESFADQLGAEVNAAAGRVSIGVRKDNLRVDTTGAGITKTKNGAIDFGDDTEAAIRFATRDLIQDGVIQGLTDAENRLIQAGDSLEDSINDVLQFRSVFDRLQEFRDPLGFAIDQLNEEFEDLINLFNRAGASSEQFAELEELYDLERARAIEESTSRVVGSLQQLLNDLTIGDSGLSLKTRQSNALGRFDDLSARVQAGDTNAFDDFAEVSQQLLEIERELFGSTQSYFDRLAQVTALTEQAVNDQTNVTSIAAGSPSPFADTPSIDRSIDIMTDELVNRLTISDRNNVQGFERLIAAINGVGSGGSSAFDLIRVSNF